MALDQSSIHSLLRSPHQAATGHSLFLNSMGSCWTTSRASKVSHLPTPLSHLLTPWMPFMPKRKPLPIIKPKINTGLHYFPLTHKTDLMVQIPISLSHNLMAQAGLPTKITTIINPQILDRSLLPIQIRNPNAKYAPSLVMLQRLVIFDMIRILPTVANLLISKLMRHNQIAQPPHFPNGSWIPVPLTTWLMISTISPHSSTMMDTIPFKLAMVRVYRFFISVHLLYLFLLILFLLLKSYMSQNSPKTFLAYLNLL